MGTCTKIFTFFSLVSIFVTGCGKDEKKVESGSKGAPKIGESKELTESSTEANLEIDENALEEEVKKRIEKELEKEPEFDFESVKRKFFLKRYKIDISKLPEKRKTLHQIEERIEKLAADAADQEYPERKRREIVKQAENEFPAINTGDLVEVKTRRGSVYGTLERIYADRIKVEKFYILLKDIISPKWVCFSKTECTKRRNHFVNVNFGIPKDDFMNNSKKKFASEVHRKEGYVFVKNSWISVDELFESKVRPEIEKLEKKYNKELEEKVRKRVEQQMQEEELSNQ